MHLRNTFGDGAKENIDKNNLAASLSNMLRGFVSVICFALFQVHAKLYFFNLRNQLDIIGPKAWFIFGSSLSLSTCVVLYVHYEIICVNFPMLSSVCTIK
jgi:pheromone shutdown protein TraB